MKKILLLIITIFMITGMSACIPRENNVPQATQTNQQQLQPSSEQSVQTPNISDTTEFIGEERAKEIAIQRAGITAEGVIFDRVELDFDDGVWEYEIEFRQNRTEFDFNIKATDGSILNFEVDSDD